MDPRHGTLWQRFWPKVALAPNGCWIWRGATGRRQRKGLDGRLRKGGKGAGHVSPHRQVLIWACGQPPTPQHQACHQCPDPTVESTLCVNPYHLYWGTQAENEADKRRGVSVILHHHDATQIPEA